MRVLMNNYAHRHVCVKARIQEVPAGRAIEAVPAS